jgi:hypothetical protein
MESRRWWWPRQEERGTVGHPYSALNLRLALALFGLVTSAALAGIALCTGYGLVALLLAAVAFSAVVDVVVILRRKHGRA